MERNELEGRKVGGMLPKDTAEFEKWLQWEKDPEKKAALEFHPDMKVRPSKLPPREIKFGKSGYERPPIACQWEVRLEQKG